MDVGGTEIKAGIFDEDGAREGEIRTFPARSRKNRETVLDNFCFVIRSLAESSAAAGHPAQSCAVPEQREENGVPAGIAMAFPGPFDYERGISLMKGLDKYDSIYGVPLKDAIRQREPSLAQTKMIFVHDVEAFAVGCAGAGAAAGKEKVLCLCIGTGAGSAFLKNGKALKGDFKGVPENGWIYNTPFRDSCIDDYLSVRGLQEISRRHLGRKADGQELYQLCQAGHPEALAVYEEFGEILQECMEPFLLSFAPNALVLGGQISKSFAYFGQKLRNTCNHLNIQIIMEDNTSFRTMQGLYFRCVQK